MSTEIADRIEQAGKLLNETIDSTGYGLISYFDRTVNTMYVNRSYSPEWTGTCKVYTDESKITDLFSKLMWKCYQQYLNVTSIAIFRTEYTMLWAQIGSSIPPFGIYHIENFYGEIPCTGRNPRPISGDYSEYLKDSIVEAFGNKKVEQVPAILLYGFGAVTFADSIERAVALARCLKTVSMTAWNQMALHKVQYIDYSVMNYFHAQFSGEKEPYMVELDTEKECDPEGRQVEKN